MGVIILVMRKVDRFSAVNHEAESSAWGIPRFPCTFFLFSIMSKQTFTAASLGYHIEYIPILKQRKANGDFKNIKLCNAVQAAEDSP